MPVNDLTRPGAGTMTVTITSARDGQCAHVHGWFFVDTDVRRLCTSRQPFRDAARCLLDLGWPPETAITAQHAGWPVMESTLAAAAQWTSFEGANVVAPKFGKR
jgi:hypothetical protein